jgi:hypothetical protein
MIGRKESSDRGEAESKSIICERGSFLRIYEFDDILNKTVHCPHCKRQDIEVRVRFDKLGKQVTFLVQHTVPE